MPESLVINLVSESTIPPQYLRGDYLHRLFLTLVSAVNANLGQSLQTHKYQAFTLSPLQIARQAQPPARNLKFLPPPTPHPLQYASRSVPAGAHCWWRISLLDDSLFANFSPRLKQTATRKPWYLGPAKLHITNLLPANIPDWTYRSSYQQLYKDASETNHHLTFQLLTPAVFRQGDHESPLPTREALFHSLRKCWNRHSGLVFAPDTVQPIVAQDFHLRTVAISHNKTMTGCIGDLSFQILPTADPLVVKRINALTNFSQYCGIGHKTDFGMGMVRSATATK